MGVHLGADTYPIEDKIKDVKGRLTGSSKKIEKKKAEVPFHSVNEPSIIHPWNQSMVKIRDNGTVDIMAGTDNGIRVNPVQKTIDVISRTNNTHASFIRAFVLKDEVRYVKNDWTIYCNNANIKAKKDIAMVAGQDISFYAKRDMLYYADNGRHYFNTKGYKGIDD